MNKEHDHLAQQLNLALVFGQQSSLPVYYRKLPGNVTDVKTAGNMLAVIDFLNLKKVHLVMDRGLYSAENINELYKKNHKFLIAIIEKNIFIDVRRHQPLISIHIIELAV